MTGVRGVATCIEIALADADAHHTVIGAGAPDHSGVIPERGSLVRKAKEGTDRNVNFHLAIPGIVLCFQVRSCLLGGALTDAVNDHRPVVSDWTVRIDLLRLQATTAIATASRLGHGASPICGGVRALDNVTGGEHRWQAPVVELLRQPHGCEGSLLRQVVVRAKESSASERLRLLAEFKRHVGVRDLALEISERQP